MTDGMPAARGSRRLWLELLHQAIAVGGLIFSLKMCLKYLDPYREQREQAKKRAAFLKQHLGRSIELNEYEQLLAANVMNPSNIDVNLEDISGLEEIVQEMELKVLYPMMQPGIYRTTLWKQSRGVLLYGPPGTGKTMLAKALAKQSGCFFLNITASSIMSKWLGDANRLVRAVFSLAEKLQPCIIFIDEVDAMLGKRGMHQEHESMLQVKTEFMQLWDGMESTRSERVVVMGATNRPWMVDEAVLRRFSLQYEVGLPNPQQRKAIITGYIKRHHQEVGEGSVSHELLNNVPGADGIGALEWIAQHTEGFSGSDLMELCAQAAQRVLGEYWMERRQAATSGPAVSSGPTPEDTIQVRSVNRKDFEAVLKVIKPATHKADEYCKSYTSNQMESPSTTAPNMVDFLKLMSTLQAQLNSPEPPPGKGQKQNGHVPRRLGDLDEFD